MLVIINYHLTQVALVFSVFFSENSFAACSAEQEVLTKIYNNIKYIRIHLL